MALIGELRGQEHREAARLSRAAQLFRIRAARRSLEPRGEREGRIQVPQGARRRPGALLGSVPVDFA